MPAVALLLMNSVILETALVKDADWYNALWVTLPLLAIAVFCSKGKKPTAIKNDADFLNALK